MLTRLRLQPFMPKGDWQKDAPLLVKWIVDYWFSLEQKNALTIGEADITANQGIKFPATQVTSTDANTLDDYEEGTWVPADGSGAALVLTVASATYTKVGRLVTLQADLTYPVTASGAAAKITAPFSAANFHTGSFWTAGAGGGTASDINGTAVQFLIQAAGNVTNANLSGARVLFTITYQV